MLACACTARGIVEHPSNYRSVGTNGTRANRIRLVRLSWIRFAFAIVWKAKFLSTVHEKLQMRAASFQKVDPVSHFVKLPARAPDPTARQNHIDLRLSMGDARVFFTPMQVDMDRSFGDAHALYMVTPGKYRKYIPCGDSSLPQSKYIPRMRCFAG